MAPKLKQGADRPAVSDAIVLLEQSSKGISQEGIKSMDAGARKRLLSAFQAYCKAEDPERAKEYDDAVGHSGRQMVLAKFCIDTKMGKMKIENKDVLYNDSKKQ